MRRQPKKVIEEPIDSDSDSETVQQIVQQLKTQPKLWTKKKRQAQSVEDTEEDRKRKLYEARCEQLKIARERRKESIQQKKEALEEQTRQKVLALTGRLKKKSAPEEEAEVVYVRPKKTKRVLVVSGDSSDGEEVEYVPKSKVQPTQPQPPAPTPESKPDIRTTFTRFFS